MKLCSPSSPLLNNDHDGFIETEEWSKNCDCFHLKGPQRASEMAAIGNHLACPPRSYFLSHTYRFQFTSKLCSRSPLLLNNDDDGFIEEEWSKKKLENQKKEPEGQVKWLPMATPLINTSKVIPLIFKIPQNYVVEAARYLIMMMMGS